MCEYMINFIHKLKHLPEKFMMNSVLENFTILQVRTQSPIQKLVNITLIGEIQSFCNSKNKLDSNNTIRRHERPRDLEVWQLLNSCHTLILIEDDNFY